MKKLFFLLIAANGAISANAQSNDSMTARSNDGMTNRQRYADSNLSRWVIDANVLGGFFNQDITSGNALANYPNAVNVNTGDVNFRNGWSIGADLQLGFFFGKRKHWGVGTGFMYLAQYGDASIDNFHVEYQSTDFNGNTFRQVVKGDQLREELSVTNLNIPVFLKYKNRFSKRWGFAADGGILVNMMMRTRYSTHASFDYEAIYKFVPTGDGGGTAVYDNSPVPGNTDVLLTKAHFLKNNPSGNVNDYFSQLRSDGYNVGLGVKPNSTTGRTDYNHYSIGFMLQPSVNYFLSDKVALNFGVYYMYQPFKNDVGTTYRVTDNAGSYNSLMRNVSASNNQSYGLNVGARFFIGKPKDTDKDGIPDKDDRCPYIVGLPQFRGCPDTDGDGIADPNDSCVTVAGIMKFNGCPDSDGDGIQDKDDDCPYNAGLSKFRGCPDRDNDGIMDKEDACPDVFGMAEFQGCPDTDGDKVPDNKDRCPSVPGPVENQGCPIDTVKDDGNAKIETPILFELNKTTIQQVSMPVLDAAAQKLNEDNSATIRVDGHADATGAKAYNQTLSVKRANAVKRELTKKGVNPKKIKVVGHGENDPAASNDSPEGRMQNRRAQMKVIP